MHISISFFFILYKSIVYEQLQVEYLESKPTTFQHKQALHAIKMPSIVQLPPPTSYIVKQRGRKMKYHFILAVIRAQKSSVFFITLYNYLTVTYNHSTN